MRSLNILPALAAALLAAACGSRREEARPIVSAPSPTASDAAYSVYDLGSRWRDQTGNEVTLASLRGTPRVVAMIYTHCSATCPMIVDAMKRLEARAPGDAGFVLVSLDPDRDSADRLAAYAREHGLSARWTLLTGTDDAVRDLAAALGTKYRRLSATELAHTNTITVLDASGSVVAQQPSWDADGSLAALRSLTH